MAGFLDGKGDFWNKVNNALMNLGVKYDDLVVKNSQTYGFLQSNLDRYASMTYDLAYGLNLSDIDSKKAIAYFEKDYVSRRNFLRNFAMNSEIDFILENICNDAIVYNSSGYFCDLKVDGLSNFISEDLAKEVEEYLREEFKKIYILLNFKDSYDAWHYLKKFLVDGFLAFEIIYDDLNNPKTIIGFKELDPITLFKDVEKTADGRYVPVWVQDVSTPNSYGYAMSNEKRKLYDSQIIYISYSRANFLSRISYVERLIRSFNLLRIIENTRIIWNVMNAQFRYKIIVPVNSKSPTQARQSLAEFKNIFKEEIYISDDSGEISINGRPNIQFFKNYIIPKKDGDSPEIETIESNGMDLHDVSMLKYLLEKLKIDSGIPFSRFGKWRDMGVEATYKSDFSSIEVEEILFYNMISRIRHTFSEIIIKPVLMSLYLKYPEFKTDYNIQSCIGLKFEDNNLFRDLRKIEFWTKSIEAIRNIAELTERRFDEVEGDVKDDAPYFDMEFIVKKFLNLSADEIKENKELLKKRTEEILEKKKKSEE